MAQSPKRSMAEALASTASGFVLSTMISLVYYWILGIAIKAPEGIGLVAILTIVSVARQYGWRRLFNRRD